MRWVKFVPRVKRQTALNCKMTIALASLRNIKDFWNLTWEIKFQYSPIGQSQPTRFFWWFRCPWQSQPFIILMSTIVVYFIFVFKKNIVCFDIVLLSSKCFLLLHVLKCEVGIPCWLNHYFEVHPYAPINYLCPLFLDC